MFCTVADSHFDFDAFVLDVRIELITFCIDNRYQYDTHKWDHAHSEFTQINWNGVRCV